MLDVFVKVAMGSVIASSSLSVALTSTAFIIKERRKRSVQNG